MFVKTFVGLVLSISSLAAVAAPNGGQIIDGKFHHIGNRELDLGPDVPAKPEAQQLEVAFQSTKNNKEFTLSVTYWSVKAAVAIAFNGQPIDQLSRSEPRRQVYVPIPTGTLKEGKNILTITPDPTDEIAVGKLSIYPRPFRELLNLQPVKLTVTDNAGKPVPARVTIVTTKGDPGMIWFAPTNATAVRPRLLYTRGTETPFELSEGDYVFYATRGMEWSRDKQTISVRTGKPTEVKLHLRREVDTTGYVAADTHIHTVTFSGHGDATVQERMLTLAGEGVELAIATDHNHHTDYRPFQQQMGVTDYFTPVTGNEVTTKVGHFNAFPMPLNGPVPNHQERDWPTLVDDIRAKGAKVVILNHPRWTPNNVFATNGLNTVTGSRANDVQIKFDAMELLNSTATLPNGFTLFRDWFALLNHGEKLKAVGSSDSHTVDSAVGQGRTYLRSSTDEASQIQVDEVVNSFLKGYSSISHGIYAEIKVDNQFGPGDLVKPNTGAIKLRLRVAAPSWIKPQQAMVFINGTKAAEKTVPLKVGTPTDIWIDFEIPAPRYDSHLVCAVFGDGVKEPCWETERDYTLAATNPIFIDADSDGTYKSPRETAAALLTEIGKNPESQWQAMEKADDGVATQMLDLIYETADAKTRSSWNERLQRASTKRPVLGDFLQSISEPKSSAAVGS